MSALTDLALAAIASRASFAVDRHAERHPGEIGRRADAALAADDDDRSLLSFVGRGWAAIVDGKTVSAARNPTKNKTLPRISPP